MQANGERRPLVDYERAAGRYDAGRRLDDEAQDRWAQAMADAAPEAPLGVVADVGCGTGQFLGTWVGLGARLVLGVEPSAAMRAEAAARLVPGTVLVAGRADRLPVLDGACDVVWLSTVVHHVGDLEVLGHEVRRVLRPGGRVLVRGYLPGLSVVPWLAHLPDHRRTDARFPSAARLRAVFGDTGLRTLDVVGVADVVGPTGEQAADWVDRMRTADSLLTAFDPAEVDAGIARLRAIGSGTLEPHCLHLLVAEAGEA